MTRTLLVTGAGGQLGRHVAALAHSAGWRVVGTFHTRPIIRAEIEARRLDLRDRSSVVRLVAELEPRAIVHTAYLQHGPGAWTVNADGAAAVAAAAARAGARLIHISSDAIFDGRVAPYADDSEPSPITPYGASKAAAETAVRALAPHAAIVRTSLLLDDDPLDMHSQMVLDILAGKRSEKLFVDEVRCPVVAADVAAAVVELIDLPIAGPINVAGPDAVSRHELGMLVAERYGWDPRLVPAASLAASGLHRPPDARLDLSRARALLTTPLRGARAFLGVLPDQPRQESDA